MVIGRPDTARTSALTVYVVDAATDITKKLQPSSVADPGVVTARLATPTVDQAVDCAIDEALFHADGPPDQPAVFVSNEGLVQRLVRRRVGTMSVNATRTRLRGTTFG
jgi:hypothetical protein